MGVRENYFNGILKNASTYYQSRVGIANGMNIDELAGTILQDKALRNEFIDAIVNKVGLSLVRTKIIEDKLSLLDGESLPFGASIEEIVTNPAIARKYDMNSDELLKNKMPDVKALYYGINRESVYEVTISYEMLRRGFRSDGTFTTMLSSIVSSLYSGDKLDNMILKKQLVKHAVTNKNIVIRPHTKNVEDMTVDDVTNLMEEIIVDSLNMVYPSSSYNMYSKVASETENSTKKNYVVTFTDLKDQYILIRNDIYTKMNVQVLATRMNMSKAELLGKIIPIDNFDNAKVMAIITDKAWWVINDLIYELDEFSNAANLTRKSFLHHHQICRYSMFANAIAYTYGDVE